MTTDREALDRCVALLIEFAFHPDIYVWVPAAELLAQLGVDYPQERPVADSQLVQALMKQYRDRAADERRKERSKWP